MVRKIQKCNQNTKLSKSQPFLPSFFFPYFVSHSFNFSVYFFISSKYPIITQSSQPLPQHSGCSGCCGFGGIFDSCGSWCCSPCCAELFGDVVVDIVVGVKIRRLESGSLFRECRLNAWSMRAFAAVKLLLREV